MIAICMLAAVIVLVLSGSDFGALLPFLLKILAPEFRL